MSETPLTRPKAYLESVTVGLAVAIPAELPGILREVARNLEHLAAEADLYLNRAEEPDDYP